MILARQATGDNVIRNMEFACYMTKATDTHSEYVLLYGFCSATIVKRTRNNFTSYAHVLSCLLSS
jgi:hypothetical protein